MLIERHSFAAQRGRNAANTFGEWNKWENLRKKLAGVREEPSEAMGRRIKSVDFIVDGGIIQPESRVVSWNECVLLIAAAHSLDRRGGNISSTKG
jgi:hypothetical protein